MMIKKICWAAFFILLFSGGRPAGLSAEEKETAVEHALDVVNRVDDAADAQDTPDTQPPAVFSSEGPSRPLPSSDMPQPSAEETDPLSKQIDVVFENTDMDEAMDFVARSTGLILWMETDVEGGITLTLSGVRAQDVLKAVLDSHQLAFREEDGILRVMTSEAFEKEYGYPFDQNLRSRIISLTHADSADVLEQLDQVKNPQSRIILSGDVPAQIILIDTPRGLEEMARIVEKLNQPVISRSFSPDYVPAQEVAAQLEPLVTETIGRVRCTGHPPKVVVTDTAEQMDRFAGLLKKWDLPRKVVIKAEAVRVALSEEYGQGIDWEAVVADYKCMTKENAACLEGERDVSVGTLSGDDHDVLMEALESVGEMKMMPGAVLESTASKDIYLKVTAIGPEIMLSLTLRGPNDLSAPAASAQDLDTGMSFYLRPVVHLDGSLTLAVSRSGLPETVLRDTELEEKSVREENRVLSVKKDAVVVIGGMFKEEKVRKTRKLPFLGDLPVLGTVFQRHRYNARRIEYVVFLRLTQGDMPSSDGVPGSAGL